MLLRPPLVRTLIPAAIVLALALWPNRMVSFLGGIALVAAAVFFVPWVIYSLVRMIFRPAERRSRAITIVIWIATFVVAFSVRSEWDTTARTQADAAVSAIQAHKARTGAYPNNLGEVGIDEKPLKDRFSLNYRVQEGKAFLIYSQPSMGMVAHHYNFETSSWVEHD